MANWMWIVGGPNGAGKSTFANQFLADLGHRGIVKLNADERALELRKQFTAATSDDLNLLAAQVIDQDVVDCIIGRRSFLVETVLSSPKYRDDVANAKAAGFKFGLIYVSLYPPELSPLRVSERVAKGGHTVAHAKAIERHRRSHDELRWFAAQADLLMVFDNSAVDAAPALIASRKNGGTLNARRGINPAVDQALADLVATTANDLPSG